MRVTLRSLLLLSAALVMAADQPAAIQFEKEANVVAKGRSPKFLARRAHGLQTLYTAASSSGRGMDLLYMSSSDLGDEWTQPLRVNNVPGEVSDHGENSPILMSSPDEMTLYAVWNARDPQNPAGSHIRFSRSPAMMPKWTDAVTVDDDAQPVSHGFQGAAVGPDGVIYVAWLDMREQGSHHTATDHSHTGSTAAVYLARSLDGGKTWEKNVRIAGNICPCCRVSIGFAGNRVIVAWRQVEAGDLRDIFAASSSDRGATWGKPVLVARDNWKIKGCPHVGPSIATLDGALYITWFSEGGGKPAIYLAASRDGGESFLPKHLVSEGTFDPTHPALAASNDRLGIVFQARDSSRDSGWGKMAVYYREVSADGSLSPLVRAGEGKTGASFPSLAVGMSGRVFIGWTETGGEGAPRAYLVRGRSSMRRAHDASNIDSAKGYSSAASAAQR